MDIASTTPGSEDMDPKASGNAPGPSESPLTITRRPSERHEPQAGSWDKENTPPTRKEKMAKETNYFPAIKNNQDCKVRTLSYVQALGISIYILRSCRNLFALEPEREKEGLILEELYCGVELIAC